MDFDTLSLGTTGRLDYFRMPVYERFFQKPFHTCHLAGKWDHEKILNELSTCVIRSRSRGVVTSEASEQFDCFEFLLRFSEDAFAWVSEDEAIIYGSNRREAEGGAAKLSKLVQPQEKQTSFYLVSHGRMAGFGIERVPLSRSYRIDEEVLKLSYGSDILDFETVLARIFHRPIGF